MDVFLRNARARNCQVEATLNHPLAAQAANHVTVVLVGASRTGKTLMAQTYAHGSAALRPPPTLGVERHVAAMPVELGGNAKLPELRVWDRAGKGCEIPNFKGSYLGRFPLVLADFSTSDHLSERSRT